MRYNIIKSIRQMGKQQSIPEPHSARNYHFQDSAEAKHQFRSNNVKQHEGILRLRSTPFPGCVEISNDGMLLFLENAQATLHELLETRLYTNRLFPLEDVEKLIENVVYTLAFLAESNVTYRDLCSANIYYCNGIFKLLPNELIQQKIYDRAWQLFYGLHQAHQDDISFPFLSPQLIIALRMKQKCVQDFEILNKSNVFTLGLILLEATTLLPSSECYDPASYDIYNNIITERLDLVQEHYNECIARLIANMIDYDFNERMDLKELAIWVNRQLLASRSPSRHNFDTSQEKRAIVPCKSTQSIQKSRCVNQPDKAMASECSPVVNAQENIPPRSYSRTNMVYITGYDDIGREDSRFVQPSRGAKNCVYLETLPQYQVDCQIDKKTDQRPSVQPLNLSLKPSNLPLYNFQAQSKNISRATIGRYTYQREQKMAKIREVVEEPKLNRNYAQNVNYVPYTAPPSAYLREVANYRHRLTEGESKKIQFNESEKNENFTAKQKNENRFYPNLSEMENIQRHNEVTKRVPKNQEVDKNSRAREFFDSKQSKQSDSKCSVNDGSINRIKMEIEKSRKLIEEFRKTEGIAQ